MTRRKNPAAVALGRKGGKATTEAKAEAAQANGAKGGRPTEYRYLVLRTAFHGGGLVSRHRTRPAAEKAAAARASKECRCGCVGVWDRKEQGLPPTFAANSEAPSQLCLRYAVAR